MLPTCRNRGRAIGADRYECSSNRLVIFGHGVSFETCLRCPYADMPNREPEPQPKERPCFESCIYRGTVLRHEMCVGCGHRDIEAAVLYCGKHGECTVHNHNLRNEKGKRVKTCVACGDCET